MMRTSKRLFHLSLVVGLLVVMAIAFAPQAAYAAGTCYSQSDGNWSSILWWCSDIAGQRALQTNDDVVIQHTVTLNQHATVRGIAIDSGKTFNNGAYTLTANGGYLTNNGTYNGDIGTYSFTAAGGVYGTSNTTFNNVTISAGVDFFTTDGNSNTHRARINGTLTINPNGYVSDDGGDGRPIYGTGSTLKFNTSNTESAPYNSNEEWDAQGGTTVGTSPGVPQNVELASSTWLSLNTNTWTRPMGGNLTIGSGSGLILQTDSNTALTVQGSVANSGTIRQARNAFNSGTFHFVQITDSASATKYYGVNLTANNFGSTTVWVSGDRPATGTCPDIASGSRPVRRCYLIDVTTSGSASATFYYTREELRVDLGQSAANLKVWRNTSGTTWTQLASTPNATCGTGQLNCSVQATSFTPTRIDGAASPEDTTDDYVLMESSPQAVTMADFSAAQTGDAVLLTWETVSELENRGFNLYRGVDPSAPDRQLNETLIPSQSQGNPGGFIYTWEDRADLTPGTTYFYWVEDVDIYGTATRHGPVSVDYGAPTAVRVLDAGAVTTLPLALPLVGAGLLALAGLAARRRRG
jgi:hypothetical protein